MPAIHPIAKRAALAALLLSLLGACQDTQTPTAPLDLQPRLTQLASGPVVNSLADPGTGTCDDSECTLREAIAFATSGATITFSVTGTIPLSVSYLTVDKDLTISGPGATELAVSGNGGRRVFMIDAGTVTISGLTITGGFVSVAGGAGILNWANLTLIDCAITGNDAQYNAGGGIRNAGTLTVKSSTISGNTGPSIGAGLYSNSPTGTVLIVNSTISGNLNPTGEVTTGISNLAGVLRIINSTISGNGEGVYTGGGTTEIKGSIVLGNDIDVSESTDGLTSSLGYNLIGTLATSVLGAEFTATGDQTRVMNAQTGPLALNTPGKTRTYALLTGSPAIDAGTCTDHLDAAITTDQRGVSRPQGSACDIGAYELVASGTTTPTFVFNLLTLPDKTFGDGSFSVVGYTSTNSTGAVTFATGTGSAGCSVTSGGTVTITGAAVSSNACIIEATLAADATYTGAGPISQSFNIAKAPGSISISNMPTSGTVGGSFTPTYTKPGDGTASTASGDESVCTVSSGVVSYVGAGSCVLQAWLAEGTNHLSATGSEQSFTISLLEPTFTFDVTGITKTYGDAGFSAADYVTTNSNGAITFAIGSSSTGCSVTSAGMVTITGAAVDPSHCVIVATLAADGAYSGSGPYEEGFNIDRAAGSVSINNMPSSPTIGSNFTPTYTKLGDGTASVISTTTGVCTVSDGVVSFIAAGTCILQASVTQGTDHLAVTGGDQSVTVFSGASVLASCTYTIHPKNGQRLVTVNWENASPGVTQIQVADGRIVTRQLAPTASGSWSTNVKIGTPTYGLWGGLSRRDISTTLVSAGTACSELIGN